MLPKITHIFKHNWLLLSPHSKEPHPFKENNPPLFASSFIHGRFLKVHDSISHSFIAAAEEGGNMCAHTSQNNSRPDDDNACMTAAWLFPVMRCDCVFDSPLRPCSPAKVVCAAAAFGPDLVKGACCATVHTIVNPNRERRRRRWGRFVGGADI